MIFRQKIHSDDLHKFFGAIKSTDVKVAISGRPTVVDRIAIV